MTARALVLNDAHASPGRQAAAWNAYIASVVPYPARYVAPTATLETSMTSHLRLAIGLAGTKWAPVYVFAGISMRFQIPGCPAAWAIAAPARARGGVWGPVPAQRRARARAME